MTGSPVEEAIARVHHQDWARVVARWLPASRAASATPTLSHRSNGFGLWKATVVGTPDSYILYSGLRAICDTHRASLAALAANSDHLGEDAGLAATYDLAMLDLYFAGMTGFLYAAALVTADGVSAKAFLPYAQRMVGLPEPIIAGLAAEVDAAEHPGDDDNLVMELAVADHIVAASAERGIDTGPPELTRSLLRRGVEQGHGWDTFSRLIDLLHRPAA